MNYKETLDWMFAQLPMFQRQGKTAFKKDLTNSIAFSKHLNFPETKFKSIHVAGTNGKGSTSHMLASILQEAGFKVGLYTSPHLKDFRERIRINGEVISKTEVIDFISTNKLFLDTHKLSFFEMTVGLAFDCFAKHTVDIVVVEVGLGGRLDSTNIITPEVSVITNIGFDHTQFLGETLPEIAFEKAGIIKNEIPVVVGEFQEETYPVFKNKAAKMNAPIFLASSDIESNYASDLKGSYQSNNIKTVLKIVEVLKTKNYSISNESVKKGLLNVIKNTGLLGRWQQLNKSPKVICDTGHNKEGLTYVFNQLMKETYEQLHIVIGVVNDKDLNKILPLFPKKAIYYFCKPDIPRGLNEIELQLKCSEFELKGVAYPSVKEAYVEALQTADKQDFVFIGGSTFVVAEVL
ncbi:MAG: bifunctional folylpolyglutamate synthase/dihydrofolate synthase [Lutibacter sp.]|uniref:bifunctional folylpolyglutamate synthase/dihydrofolate synthase n=1 Tax=Lutibacter sp. TaxID=1925666 RepID=UPI0018141A87|nr:folylpolyglutamate synthase/dihydrofolate synthase family protein [Lutibacter sp.]MBT8317982.1 bifunctional folylpolyglutamate synthase/dihydrofolate synthase [Lutibacter sp.]NNJ58841.1 bifunctional folylpolyglutamate synthase/dihydrofolate synthase [Lutibacter sp.]